MRLPDSISRHLTTWLAWILVCLSHLAMEIVATEVHGQAWEVCIKFVVVVVLSGGILFDMLRRISKPTGFLTLLSLVAMISPMIVEPIWRMFTHGHAFEVQLLIGFRNLALVLIVSATSSKAERLAVICSLFVLLFCVSTSNNWGLSIICAAYLLVGSSWLFSTYWSELKTEHVVGKQKSAPWFVLAFSVIFTFIALSFFVLPNSPITRMTRGFMPSSGGTEDYSEEARSGVGDGDALVAATDNALSFAPLEDAPFVEGNEPSLYDVFQDTYGVGKPPKKQDRAISLPPEEMKTNHHHMAKAKKSSRTFSMLRKPPQSQKHRHLKDTESNAILHLVGRVPVHLRHTTYSLFDGLEWFPEELEEERNRRIRLQNIDEKPWMTWNGNNKMPIFSNELEPHSLRVLNVETNRVLSPLGLLSVHIDKIDRVDMFNWKQQDILGMDRRKLPTMTVIQLNSRLVDQEKLNSSKIRIMGGKKIFHSTPEGPLMEEIADLANEWTKSCHSNWERIVTIRERLRTEFQHDPEIVVPEDCDNPVAWFLFNSKRGPDYLFTTSAVMLYRSLGLSSRAVSGFYANPKKYDSEAQQTSVHPSDVHWWAEVYVGSQVWTTIEPTPGFETLQPERTLIAKAVLLAKWIFKKAVSYWPVSLGFLLMIGLAGYFYRTIYSLLLTWKWKLNALFDVPNKEFRPLVLNIISILDKKLVLADQPRPISSSFGTYLRNRKSTTNSLGSLSSDELDFFSKICDWAAYSPNENRSFKVDRNLFHSISRRLLKSLHISNKQDASNVSQKKENSQ